MNNRWESRISALKEELKVAKLRRETLTHSHGQLTKELEVTRMQEQATWVEIFALRLHSTRLQ